MTPAKIFNTFHTLGNSSGKTKDVVVGQSFAG